MTGDQAAIRALIARYALTLDAGEIEQCVQLFADDAEFLVYGRSFAGRGGIGSMFRAAPRGLHLTGVSWVDVHGDTATARSQVLFVRADNQQLRPALYDDELIRVDGDWLFSRRQCRFVTARGLSDSPQVS
jgi:uncharacterized protein (TIGR02246 family)